MMFEGVLLSVMADTGPYTQYNLSKLDDTSSMKLSISLMTALGLGESQDQINQLHGSFPVPGRKELAIAFPFTVASRDSTDPRIQEFGRYFTLFFLFLREAKSQVLANYELIERTIAEALKPITKEEQITIELMKHIYTTIESTISAQEGSSAPKAIKQSASNFAQIQIDHDWHQVL
ncbi:MAG: hypothetical protein KAT16_08145, partial [Candidatus Heimdallarchaeota archaeon]|nr:hypothetical protein [Candidatus Heimdallarchaeota archaeon]